MSGFDGNGNFIMPYNWTQDKNNGIKIRADRMDGQDGAIATGFGDCVTRDGQSPATANLPMGTFKHTGVGNGTARDQYATVGQVQDGGTTFVTSTGTIDAYAVTLSPAPTVRTPGLTFFVRMHVTSITPTPTMAVNGIFTATVCYGDGSPLDPAALVANGVYEMTDAGTVGIVITNKLGAAVPLSIKAAIEKCTIVAGTIPTTVQHNLLTQSDQYYTTNTALNWCLNLRASATMALDTMMQVGDIVTTNFLAAQGASPFYNSSLTIDGANVTPKWLSGVAPAAGIASSINIYRYSVIKTAAATFTVIGALSSWS